jgi:hypothetical protein
LSANNSLANIHSASTISTHASETRSRKGCQARSACLADSSRNTTGGSGSVTADSGMPHYATCWFSTRKTST